VAAGLQLLKASPGDGLCSSLEYILSVSALITEKTLKILSLSGSDLRGAYTEVRCLEGLSVDISVIGDVEPRYKNRINRRRFFERRNPHCLLNE